MKPIFLSLCLSLCSSLAFAANLSGKYELQLSNGLSGMTGTFEFLVNGHNEVKLLNEYDGYHLQDFQVNPFFGELSFDVEWGSDEEQHYFSLTLEELNEVPVLTKACSLYVDGPNGFHEFDELSLSLKKWNSSRKTYEDVPLIQNQKTFEKCREELGKRHLSE